ncbi:MAG: ORF6N domain-containing protein [Planctomycetes bacterium]|nr:ORF6N domain-containing protein [Planctomycetota bacterium]
MFRLTDAELLEASATREPLKSQFATSKGNRSQIATGSQRHRDPRFLPFAFTEHGAIHGLMNPPPERTRKQIGFHVRPKKLG